MNASRRLLLIGCLTLLPGFPVLAHHSSAMYDSEKTVTLMGSVKEFQWTNPHCWIQLVVKGANSQEEWSIQMGPPSYLYNYGWRPGTVKPGETVTLVVHPMRDGSRGGLWVSGTSADGKPIGSVPVRAQ